VSRKGAKPRQRQVKPSPPQDADAATVSVLPMEIQVGDRFTDEEGEWEVVSHPAALHGSGGRNSQRQSATVTWPAHVRVEIRLSPSQE
jgi:hypothetical protein